MMAGGPSRRSAFLTATIMVAAAGVATGLIVTLAHMGGQNDALGIAPGPPTTPATLAFTVVYRVDDTAGAQAEVETDVLAVRRPFDVRLEHRAGAPPGGTVLAGSIETRQSLVSLGGAGDGLTTPKAPDIGANVISAPALRAAADAGVARELGAATVIGQRCTRYAYRALGTEPLSPPDQEGRVESCVTPDSIMLREAITLEGRQVRVAEAVSLHRSPSFGQDAFAPVHPSIAPTDQLTDQVVDGAPEGAVSPVPVPLPPGFHADRRASVGHAIGPDTPPVLYYAQRFVDGSDEIVVEQPLDADAGSPWTGRGGSAIDLGNGHPSEILYHTGFVEIQTRVRGFPVRVMAPRAEVTRYVATALS